MAPAIIPASLGNIRARAILLDSLFPCRPAHEEDLEEDGGSYAAPDSGEDQHAYPAGSLPVRIKASASFTAEIVRSDGCIAMPAVDDAVP